MLKTQFDSEEQWPENLKSAVNVAVTRGGAARVMEFVLLVCLASGA